MYYRIYILIITFVLGSSLLFLPIHETFAQTPFTNFGGITGATICPCSETWLVVVTIPKPALVVYLDTPQYADFLLPASGVWALGLYAPVQGVCLFPGAPYGCATPIQVPNMGVITLVGTGPG